MVKVHRNLVLVLGADEMAGLERGGAGRSRLTFAGVTAGGRVYEMPVAWGGKPARAVGACAAGKPPVQRECDVGNPSAGLGLPWALVWHRAALVPVSQFWRGPVAVPGADYLQVPMS